MAGIAVVAAGMVSTSAAPAAAAAPLQCLNTLYYTSSAGTVRQVDLTTRTLVTAQPYAALPAGAGTTPNQIGIGADGSVAMHGTSTSIVRYTPAIDQTTVVAKPSGVGSGTVGAVNPRTGLFYYGAYTGNTLNLYVYNPATTTSTTGVVAAISVSNAPGANGDIAFDEAGRLYMVAGDGTSPFGVALYRMNGTIPTTPSGTPATFTSVEISRGNNTGGTNGIAFASDGYLYISTGTSIRQLNPITGETVGTDIPVPGGGITDLGTCAGPTTVTVGTTFPAGPVKPGDTFTPGGSGGGNPGSIPGSGTGTTTPPAIVIPGEPVTVVQTPGPSTNPNEYVTRWECRSVDGTLISSGESSPGTFTPHTGTDGNSITCTFSNDLPSPGLTVAKTVTPTSFSAAGTTLTYTFTVRNTGNTVLNDVRVTDTVPGLSPVTCTPAQGSTLLPAAPYLTTPRAAGTLTCTATYVTTAADVAAGANKVNSATVAGTPPTGQGTRTTSPAATATTAFQAVPPTAVNDAVNTPFNTPVALAGSTNDTPGNGAINAALTVFTAAGTTAVGKTLTTAQGVWNVQTDGTVLFTPAPGYTGTTPPVEYRITDSNGQTATATLTVTVRPGPVAVPDVRTTQQDLDVLIPVLDNDTAGITAAGTTGTKVATSVVFPTTGQPAGATVTDEGRTLTVAGQGVYTADPTSGVITFDPAPTFTGGASPVSYSFTDGNGSTATSTITVTVSPVNPVAIDDAATTVFGTAVTLPGSTNDVAGPGGAIRPDLTVFTSTGATNDGRSLVTPEGTWEIQPDGTVVFDPATGYVGTTPVVEYRITDANGQSDTATLRVTVRPGPSAVADTATTPQNVDVSFPILDDDTAGLRVDGSQGELVPASVAFQTTGLPVGSEVSADGRTLTVPGEGVYTWDPATALVTFDPEPTFTGVATPVVYTVLDQEGNVASATITVTVEAITPIANDNAAKTPAGTPVELDAPADDLPGADSAPLDLDSVVLTSPDADQGGTRLVVEGEGTWTVGPQGVVTFTPEAGFEGPATPVEYSIADTNGTRATATLTVVVGTGPLATTDAATTPQNTPVTLVVLTNDVAGDMGAACDPATPGLPEDCDTGTLLADSVALPTDGQPAGAVVAEDGKSLTVPGEGTYTVQTDGSVTFLPVATFTGGATPVRYAVTDSYGNTATATVEVTVLPITPVATDDQLPTPYGTPVTLPGATNDTAGTAGGVTPAIQVALTRFPAESQPATATVSDDGRSITVEGQGTYVANGDGTVTFTPADGFVGTTTPVTYRIEDANGTTDDAALSVVVRPGPQALPDVESTLQGVPVSLDPATNDVPGRTADDSTGTFDGSLTVFPAEGQPAEAVLSSDGKTLTVPGEGVYTIDGGGVVTFTPERSFAQPTTTSVVYRVTDDSGSTATSTITILVTAVVPVALDDQAATPFATPVTFPITANDVAGDDVAPIDAASATFEVADLPEDSDWTISEAGTVLTVPGEGTWTLADDGSVTFAPEATFSGDTTPVTYTVRDTNGSATSAQLLVTVQPGPVVVPAATTTPQGVAVGVDVLTGGTPGPDADGSPGAWVPESLLFPIDDQPTGATVSQDGRTLTVPGQGVYTVDPETNEIVFTPEPTFRGEATPITYAVTDTHGNVATATVTVTVTGIDPVVTPDSGQTPSGTPVTIPGATNDLPGADTAPLVPEATTFPVEGQPEGSVRSEDGKQLVVPGEGTWTVEPDGSLTFTPEPTFVGGTTPITYEVVDTNGTPGTGTGTVTVRPGPTAAPNTATTPQNVTVDVDVLVDDVPGQNADGTAGTWDLDTLTFPTDGQPEGATVSADGTQLTVPGQGVYTVDPETFLVTFDPEPGFRGVATPVTYAVTDSHGNTATATLTITVTGIDPIATDDAAGTPFNTPVLLTGLTDDLAGAESAPLDAAATVFPSQGQPTGAVVSPDGRQLVLEGVGTFVVQTDGSVLFTPVDGYEGTTAPVVYRIADVNGTTATATLTVTIQDGPVAADDEGATRQNVDVEIAVLDNDSPGLTAAGEPGTWDAASVVFTEGGQPEGAEIAEDGKQLTVPVEGVYTIAPDGVVTFDPEPAFRGGTTPVRYAVTDSLGSTVEAEIRVIVAGIDPVAVDDTSSTPSNTPITLPGVGNDTAGDDSAPLVPDATVFPLEGQPDGAERSEDGRQLVVPGQGTWAVTPEGGLLFTPEPGFAGTTTPVTYEIRDTNGTTDTATATVTVRPGPLAGDDAAATQQNTPVVVDVLGNDRAGENVDGGLGDLDPTSVVLPTDGQPEGAQVSEDGRQLVLPGVGTWTVDPVTGAITFTPEPAFTGATPPVTYAVTDNHGNTATATVVVVVAGVTPVATDDRGTTRYGTPVTLDVLANDTAGSTDTPLVADTLRLVNGAGELVTSLDVPGEGTWTVVDGALVFTPADGFTGVTSPVTYSVADSNGTRASAVAVVEVLPTGGAGHDSGSTPGGTPVTVPVLDNDLPGQGESLDPGSVCVLVPGTADCVKEHTTDGVGTWVVNPDGTVTFTPVPGFSGDASIDYQVTDTAGVAYTATLTVTVAPVAGEPGATPPLGATGFASVGLLAAALTMLLVGRALQVQSRRRGTTA